MNREIAAAILALDAGGLIGDDPVRNYVELTDILVAAHGYTEQEVDAGLDALAVDVDG